MLSTYLCFEFQMRHDRQFLTFQKTIQMNLVSILTNQASFILEQSNLSEEIYDFYNKQFSTPSSILDTKS